MTEIKEFQFCSITDETTHLPCPFCGKQPEYYHRIDDKVAHYCELIQVPFVVSRNVWNSRYEPTCTSSYCKETDEWQCDTCGGTLQECAMFDPDVDAFVDVPKYCPNCGKRVVEQ